MTDDTQQTHSEECWRWHLGCAERKMEALQAEIAALECERESWSEEAREWRAWCNANIGNIPLRIMPDDIVEHCNKRTYKDGRLTGLCVLTDGHRGDCAPGIVLT